VGAVAVLMPPEFKGKIAVRGNRWHAAFRQASGQRHGDTLRLRFVRLKEMRRVIVAQDAP
jgi:hypothetical protein